MISGLKSAGLDKTDIDLTQPEYTNKEMTEIVDSIQNLPAKKVQQNMHSFGKNINVGKCQPNVQLARISWIYQEYPYWEMSTKCVLVQLVVPRDSAEEEFLPQIL